MTTNHLPMQVAAAPSEALTHGFLLIEPATLAHATALAAFDMRPCTPRILAHREELMPRLIDVAALNEAARITVTEAWEAETVGNRPPVVCAWLDSDLDGDSLVRHIARYLVGPGVDGKPVFWRFYDPRVLALTLAVFDPSQRQALLGPIQAWQFIWAGHRWAVSGPGIPTDVLEGNVPAWPRSDQWARINRSDAATQVLDRLTGIAVQDVALLPAALDRLLSDAIQFGLTQADDLADYAWHCMKYGPAFERHPMLVEARPAIVDGSVTWPEIVSRFTPDDFQQLEQSSRLSKAQRTES
ncbi:conserved hypothetical protein [Burkholderia gladioli]|uniref:DUF4123 domain-containing protein n=1 Tax=Burkholderia gladioli TaxID=28095 RepID=UPI0006869AA1|nr:DUF4123 domain-containing protein [Burkholderia gladioli]CAG9218153.1 conserved hypothetical protein [Burkholderia gladioli]